MPRLANSMAASFESSCHGLSERRISSYHTVIRPYDRRGPSLSSLHANVAGTRRPQITGICAQGLAISQSNDVEFQHSKHS